MSVFRSARTWWSSCTFRQFVRRVFEMKVSVGTIPSTGSVQRDRVSKPIVDSLEN